MPNFDEYIRNGEPDKKERASAWKTAIGLQAVDGLQTSDYLKDTHPDLARFFDPNYALRPISTTFTATIINGSEYQNPGY